MSLFFHSLAQGAGWMAGSLYGLLLAILVFSLLKKLLANPMGKLPLKAQQKLFQAYWRKLEAKQRYEELAPLRVVLAAYAEGKQPTRKQLKPFKLVTKKKFKLGDSGMKFSTIHRIKPA